MFSKQASLFDNIVVSPRVLKEATTSTFQDNLRIPIHRWFRYSAGFSAAWAQNVIEAEASIGRKTVFDPFAGSGTVLLAAEAVGIHAQGTDSHPFIARIARAKLHWRENPTAFKEHALNILKRARGLNIVVSMEEQPPLLFKCFPTDTLSQLLALRETWKATADSSPPSELTWLALASILRSTSPVGTAQWQYILPKKSKTKTLDVFDAFRAKVEMMADDMVNRQALGNGPKACIHQEDIREATSIQDEWADLIITSPPYANNYDYADATRLEMTFFQDIEGWGDLQQVVRKHLIRACTQHVGRITKQTKEIASGALLEPIHDELMNRVEQLERIREGHGGKKQYHTMIAAYFHDMARVWSELRRVTKNGSLVCFVIGDSAPYGVHIPVDDWLGRLAVASGFESYSFEKTRDRNVKWRNRKHRVPLHEGRLWIRG